MKVKAIRKGYYNHRRRYEGDIFMLKDEKLFSETWMKKVEGKSEEPEEVVEDELEDDEVI